MPLDFGLIPCHRIKFLTLLNKCNSLVGKVWSFENFIKGLTKLCMQFGLYTFFSHLPFYGKHFFHFWKVDILHIFGPFYMLYYIGVMDVYQYRLLYIFPASCYKEIFYKLYYLHTSSNKHTHTNQMIVWFIPLPCSFITNPFEYKYSSTVKWFTTWSNIWAKIQFSDTDWTGLCSSRIVCKYFYLLHLLWIMF